MKGIPVLEYHHVNTVGSSLNVTPKNFERQMKFLKESGYHTLNTDGLLAIIKGYKQVPKKAVMITFDDGWLDNWFFAFPILQRYEHKAVLFIVTSWITSGKIRNIIDKNYMDAIPEHKRCWEMILDGKGSDIMLSWKELDVMQKSGLIDVQSHTHTHVKLDKMNAPSKITMDNLYKDLKISKEIIEERLNKKCIALCWPWGIYNENYINLAVSLGYELLFTTERGTNVPEIDPLRIKRIAIGNKGPFKFRKKLIIYSDGWLGKLYKRIF